MAAVRETKKRIQDLLDAIIEDFPRRKKDAEAVMRKGPFFTPMELRTEPPVPVKKLPTFGKRLHPLTPMLKARFEYASSWTYGLDTWLSPTEMRGWMKKRDVRQYHRALRQAWELSAPNLFPDDQLTLLEVTKGVRGSLVYLAWSEESKEPEVWWYSGQEPTSLRTMRNTCNGS